MAKRKSGEARRLTALGTAVHNWSNVLFTGVSVADVSDMQTMREVAQMEDTAGNRELLQAAVYRCGLPESEADSLAQWAFNSYLFSIFSYLIMIFSFRCMVYWNTWDY